MTPQSLHATKQTNAVSIEERRQALASLKREAQNTALVLAGRIQELQKQLEAIRLRASEVRSLAHFHPAA